MGFVSILRWGVKGTYSFGSLKKRYFSHWSQWLRLAFSKGPKRVGASFPSSQDGNRFSFQNVVYSSIQNSGPWTKSINPVILSAIHHRQNLLDRRMHFTCNKWIILKFLFKMHEINKSLIVWKSWSVQFCYIIFVGRTLTPPPTNPQKEGAHNSCLKLSCESHPFTAVTT
jgi:hypothetical protein